MATPSMSLKLLVDNGGQRVLFAEAPKEFVDFLLHLFSLPIGSLVQLLGSKEMVGSLGKLKGSIDSLHETYLQPGIKKDCIFNPRTAFNGNTFLLSYDDTPAVDQSASSKTIYRCSSATISCSYCCRQTCRSNATLFPDAICTGCNSCMNVKMNSIMTKEAAAVQAAAVNENTSGYVKEVVTYMVMDDLVVTPMSTISSITLISKLGVKDLSQLEEKTVSFGKDEGLKLLKASLMTEKVLTSIFFALE